MESLVVFGEQVAVEVVKGAPTVNAQIPEPVVVQAIQEAGFEGEELAAMVRVLGEGGFLRPSAWAVVVRQELIDVGVPAGSVNAVVAAFQGAMIKLCGVGFARIMSGSLQTDAEVAQRLLKAKHAPAAPEVKAQMGWAPLG